MPYELMQVEVLAVWTVGVSVLGREPRRLQAVEYLAAAVETLALLTSTPASCSLLTSLSTASLELSLKLHTTWQSARCLLRFWLIVGVDVNNRRDGVPDSLDSSSLSSFSV